ncbi:amino acid/polyamine transporter I [Aspergillus tamarii]|uniref:Amino acid/polyamine transporter I n=1 Tax=Aspergillus tamarii TaxID=41984 RepID=A0A5N6VAZ1_ASPTM|nr:amino acid/polyamine transporter I [Aspergillus tamarii]
MTQIDEASDMKIIVSHDTNVEEKAAAEGEIAIKPKVHFSLLGAIGVQYSVTSAPIAIGAYLSLAIGLGGSPAYFWGFFMVGFFQLFVCLATAELASAIPHSSGPAYWAIALASPQYSRGLGYIMGWLTNAGWFFVSAASTLYPAQITMGLIEAAFPDFTAKSWQTYLLYVCFALLYLFFNLPRIFRSVNLLLRIVVFAVNGTAIYLLVSLLVRTGHKQSAQFVFVDFVNESGWSSNGVVFFLALLPAVGCLSGFDNATHLTDELENPRKQVPQVILGSFVMSYFTALPMIIVYQFCNVEPGSLLTAPGNQPIIQLMLSAFRSFAMTAFGTSMIIFCFFIAGTSALISWSRLYWSFSAQGALPFSTTMAKLSSRDALPVNALCWNTALICAIGAISIGSTTAMNALLGTANLCILSTFAMVFGLLLYRGRKALDPERWFNLGRWGDFIVLISLLWVMLISVILCLPLYLPVTPEAMNWTSAVFAGVLILAGAYWLCVYSRKTCG